jgi:peptidoglycan L-alanyl-D-glutamate endopeptidase CwlK
VTERDRKRLGACDQRLLDKLERVLDAMAVQSHPMMVTSGARTTAEQILLWKQGRETPGPIVTQISGIGTDRSEHQKGRAADVCFLTPDGAPTWEGPWSLFGEVAEGEGLAWGGRWRKFPDKPHVELKPDLPKGALRA